MEGAESAHSKDLVQLDEGQVAKNKRKRRDQRSDQGDYTLPFVLDATNEHAARYVASPWLRHRLQQRFRWHSLFAKSMEAASSIIKRNMYPELFNAYLILGSRWFSHHEAIEMLLLTGRYGDCMALLLGLLEDTDLITYFAYYPEDASDWRQKLSRAPVWTDEVYRQGINQFRMVEVWKKLREKDVEPLGQGDYHVLSATVHASPWGARFYGRVTANEPDQLHLSLAPIYDPVAAFSIGLFLQGTLPSPIHAFLVGCSAAGVPKSEYRSIQARYQTLIPQLEEKMKFDSWFGEAMTNAEWRVAGGEDPEKVMKEVQTRFDEVYGSEDDSSPDHPG